MSQFDPALRPHMGSASRTMSSAMVWVWIHLLTSPLAAASIVYGVIRGSSFQSYGSGIQSFVVLGIALAVVSLISLLIIVQHIFRAIRLHFRTNEFIAEKMGARYSHSGSDIVGVPTAIVQ